MVVRTSAFGKNERRSTQEAATGWENNRESKTRIPRLSLPSPVDFAKSPHLFCIRNSLNDSKCCPSFLCGTTGKILMAITPCFSKCGSRTYSISLTQELIRNKVSGLTHSAFQPDQCMSHYSLGSAASEPYCSICEPCCPDLLQSRGPWTCSPVKVQRGSPSLTSISSKMKRPAN